MTSRAGWIFFSLILSSVFLVSNIFSWDQFVLNSSSLSRVVNDDGLNFAFENETGTLSAWARSSKRQFLEDCSSNLAHEWVIVMGNEAGDTDSMAAAIAWAYYLSNLKEGPQKSIALLQTVEDALYLRPENLLALNRSRMAPRHRDLLTINELPIKPFEISKHLKGIVLVDHNVPTPGWREAPILSIIDHHQDRNLNKSATPRVIEPSASCSSLVANLILDSEENRQVNDSEKKKSRIPDDLIDLLLRAIAIDSDGLRKHSSYKVDRKASKRLFKLSQWRRSQPDQISSRKWIKAELKKLMRSFEEEMASARGDLEALDLRDLFRRDWKTIAVPTQNTKYPTLTLGFGSIPYSMEDQIERTPEKTTPEWFAIERAFTSEIGADVSIILSKSTSPKTKKKERQLVVVVAHGWGKRLDSQAATDLFDVICKGIEDEIKTLQKWERPDKKPLLERRMAWKLYDEHVGNLRRKVVMPIVQRAVSQWHSTA
ncbi:hypothetical protein PPACK8108_LOCUS19943 [Phakopsora pachyrhizi]|uniref:Exopolyphosphatase n=2 Tax=Phakopsora pachyrhizi TaxID=170000 RepID=A0AAV0BIP6_PHAPC|nr:hypothetical protein PPACK8108_LOCUS19943 [Phakopsora pachyrhizi]